MDASGEGAGDSEPAARHTSSNSTASQTVVPPAQEADYSFSLSGLMGVITVARLGQNKYEYSLDIPGDVLDMSSHIYTVRVARSCCKGCSPPPTQPWSPLPATLATAPPATAEASTL